MENDEPKPLKAGGQALADGVFMRTERAWAIARADGTVETGELPPAKFARVPVLRVLVALGRAFALGIGKGLLGGRKAKGKSGRGRKANQRFLVGLIILQIVTIPIALWLDGAKLPGWSTPFIGAGMWAVIIGGMRLFAPSAMWRYHGAEHKAVSALETGVDLRDTDAVLQCPRVHNRCGTNLVFVLAAATVVPIDMPTWLQPIAFVLGFAAVAELVGLAAAYPRFPLSRLLLVGGRWLQRTVTTLEPTREEQEVGCRALIAAVEEHERIVNGIAPLAPIAADAASPSIPVAAAAPAA